MEVYKFSKCLLDRLEESIFVLPWKDEMITASQVRSYWATYLELNIEPAGWQAVWNMPRVICEVLNVRYPTSVFGYIEQVLFKDLRAVFVVEAAQEEDVNLMERHEVALEELWPTISQENDSLNVERTANCLDGFRFFYTHVWMPWDNDNDDELNWVEKHLELRIQFCYDLRKGCINRKMAQRIRSLLTEAKYIQHRREFLELSDYETDGATTLNNIQGNTELMRLYFHLSMIRNEIEILENPEMRQIYAQVHLGETVTNKDDKDSKSDRRKHCFIITQACTLARQIDLLRKVEAQIEPTSIVELSPVLLDALNKNKPHDEIFLAPGKHKLKYMEFLNDDGYMCGIVQSPSLHSNDIKTSVEEAIISSPDDDSVLLVINGNYTFENLTFDCSNVRTGILLKCCNVTLKNCRLIGDGKSNTQQGIICTGTSNLTLNHCTIEKFANGIEMRNAAKILVRNSKIINCKIGLDFSGQTTSFDVKNTQILNASKYGIHVENLLFSGNLKTKRVRFDTFKELSELTDFKGDCEFKNCKINIDVINGNMTNISTASLASIRNDSDDEQFDDCVENSSNNSVAFCARENKIQNIM